MTIPRIPLRSPEVTLGQDWRYFSIVCSSCHIRIWWKMSPPCLPHKLLLITTKWPHPEKHFFAPPRCSLRLTPLCPHVTFLHNSTWAFNSLATVIYPLHMPPDPSVLWKHVPRCQCTSCPWKAQSPEWLMRQWNTSFPLSCLLLCFINFPMIFLSMGKMKPLINFKL